MKLRVKFTLIVSGLVIAIFVVTALSVFSHYKKSIKETVAQQQSLMISLLADEIDSKLLTAQEHLIAVAKTMPRDIMRNPAKAQAFLDGRPSLHIMLDNHLFLFTPAGRIFVESPYAPGRRGFDLSFRDYIINTIKIKKPYISDPYFSSQPHRHPVIMLTVPIFDAKGAIEGILTGSIDLMRDNFLGRISNVKIGKTGYLYLTTADRTLIMHADKKRILTKQTVGMNRFYDRAIDGFEGTDDTITSYGIKMVSSCRRLKAKNWILLANYPAAEAYRPVRQAKQYFLTATIIVIVAVFFIISFIIKYLLNPLEIFSRHIKDLPQKTGNNRFLDINTKDEIGTLSGAFNEMVTEIDSKRTALERSEELYRTVTEFSSDFVFWIAPDKRIIYVSQNCEKFCGYTQEEFYALPELLGTIIHPDDRAIWEEHTRFANKNNLHEQLELRMITKSGETCWISHSCLPVYDREGNYKGRRGSHRDITESKRAEEQIGRALLEKETLLREVHHRVKNNLAIVSSLLALQSKQIKDNTLKAVLADSQQRIRAMALVHEKLYQTTDFSQIDFGDYINTIVNELLSTFNIQGKAITTRMNIEDIKLDLEYAIPCGLMINELLTNSFKYAFPWGRGGEIAISFIKSGDIYTLTIKDSGIGLPDGFDYKETSTLGLQLVNVLARQIRGTLQMNSDGGTEAVITFHVTGDNH